MQNRRIVDRHLAEAGATARPVVESDSNIALYAQIASGRLSSIVAERLAAVFAQSPGVRALPIVSPEHHHAVGLVMRARETRTPLLEAFLRRAEVAFPHAK